MYSELVYPLVNQAKEVLLVTALITPVDHQDFHSMQLEAAWAPHHPASVPLMDPEAPVLPTWVDLQAPHLALETSEDTPFSVRDMEGQAAFPGQAVDLVLAWEVDLDLPALGLQVPEATALSQ